MISSSYEISAGDHLRTLHTARVRLGSDETPLRTINDNELSGDINTMESTDDFAQSFDDVL